MIAEDLVRVGQPCSAETVLQAEIAEQDALKPGEAVRIHNLTGRPELNHRRGKVVSYVKAKGRYAVEVLPERDALQTGLPNVMLFKLANLQLVSVEDVAPLEPHSIVLPQQHLSPSRYTDNRGAGPPATAEDDAAGDSLDYDALLASIDFAMLRDHLLRAGSRPGCAPMPGRQLRQLPAHRSCLVGLVGILLRSRDGPATLVQQAADALSRICTFGAAGRSAVRRAGGAAALVHAVHNPPSAPQLAEDGDAEDESDAASLPPAPPTTHPEVPSLPPGSKFDPTLVPRAACHALTNLANGDMACKEAVAEAGGAAALVGTMKQFAQAEDDILAPIVCKLCVGGLANIAAGDPKCMLAVLKTNSVVEVVRALKTFGPEWPELAADCCLALTNFAAGKGEGAEAVVDAGGKSAARARVGRRRARQPCLGQIARDHRDAHRDARRHQGGCRRRRACGARRGAHAALCRHRVVAPREHPRGFRGVRACWLCRHDAAPPARRDSWPRERALRRGIVPLVCDPRLRRC
jgi:hypothetical protein